MSTAQKWFVSDGEYLASTEDYAVVGRAAGWVKQRLREDYYRGEDHPRPDQAFQTNLRIMFDDPAQDDVLNLDPGHQLLYLDVDSKDPGHQTTCRQLAKENFLEEELEQTNQAKEKLVNYLVDDLHDPNDMEEGEDPAEWSRKNREYVIEMLSHGAGSMSHNLVDYILSLKTDAERDEALRILSGQALRKSPRPVGLLIHATDDCTSETLGKMTGWVAAYHLRNDLITIKRFLSDETHHPLSEKWIDDLPDDGICFHGRPSVFVAKLLELREKLQNKEDALADPQVSARRLLVYYDITRWIVKHWKALAAITQVEDERPMTDEDFGKIKIMRNTIYDLAASINFSYTIPKASDGQRKGVHGFKSMEYALEKHEEFIRDEVLSLKEAGQETAAQNAAKVYGEILGKLQQFNMDPDKPL
ncbi:MAG: hypothetical protein Q9174_004619 [Haloplaca sp. 1 TL-2023]